MRSLRLALPTKNASVFTSRVFLQAQFILIRRYGARFVGKCDSTPCTTQRTYVRILLMLLALAEVSLRVYLGLCCNLRMDPMGSAGEGMTSAQTVIVRTPRAPPFLPASSGGAQFAAAAFFQSPSALAGMRPPFLGTPSPGEVTLRCAFCDVVLGRSVL